MKDDIRKALEILQPELSEGLHLPQLAVVTAIPDPPVNGEKASRETPKYAVNCRLLDARLQIRQEMPELLDVPVALTAAGPARGIAALPAVDTVVEVAFAYGQLSLPFVRSVLPYNLKLPAIDADSQRWQQSATSFQQVDGSGNWQRTTIGEIQDTAGSVYRCQAPSIWIGTDAANLLALLMTQIGTIISALNTIAAHDHGGNQPTQSAVIAQAATDLAAIKAQIDAFTEGGA